MDLTADLAASCLELVGTAGVTSIKLRQLNRVYPDVPSALPLLQTQVAESKKLLDRLLEQLDQDQPAFQHPNDIQALELHSGAISFLIKDVQEHIATLDQAKTGSPGTWASVQDCWKVDEIVQSEARLGKQLDTLRVYLGVSRPESEAQQLVEVTDPVDKACLLAAWDDAATYTSIATAAAEANTKYLLPPTRAPPAKTEAGSTSSTTNPVGSQTNSPVSSMSHPYSPAYGQFVSAIAPTTQHSESSHTTPQSHYQSPASTSSPVQVHSLPTASSAALATTSSAIRGMSPAAPVTYSLSHLNRLSSSKQKSSYWLDSLKGQNLPSARKLKSMAMLQKSTSATVLHDLEGQGDELYPAEFKSRVSEYARGVSPMWELRTVPAKKKGIKQRYCNRFTRNPDDNIAPEKLLAQFKVQEKDLWNAILHKEGEKVSKIMQHRWSDNIVVEKRDRLTALHVASSLGLCGIVQALLSVGASPNLADKFGAAPLHHAADFGCANCLQLLVTAGANVDLESPKTKVKTPIYYAARKGKAEATHVLLELGAHVYTQSTNPQETILYAAIESGSIETVEVLLNRGANPSESFDVLALAASVSHEMLNHLVRAGADIDVKSLASQETLLRQYILKSDASMVAYLLSLGAKPPLAVQGSKRTALHLSLNKGGSPSSATLVQALLKAGEQINAQNTLGQAPLHLAVLWGRADVAEILCQAGANIHLPDSKGSSPLAEVRIPGYEQRVGSSGFTDFVGTRAVLERWHQRFIHGGPIVPEMDGQPTVKPGYTENPVELSGRTAFKPGNVENPVELSSLPKHVAELDAGS
jgi:ankyrin repeat protein